jgi:RimJ/RimL family protein N-acetyltransferase
MKAYPAEGNAKYLVVDYVRKKLGTTIDPELVGAFVVLSDDGTFCGAILISEYRGHDCNITVVTETPLVAQPGIIKAVCQYVFGQLGCARMTACTRKTNKRARKALEHLGFQIEGNLRKGYDGKRDALVYGMLASECRYFGSQEPVESGEGVKAPALAEAQTTH